MDPSQEKGVWLLRVLSRPESAFMRLRVKIRSGNEYFHNYTNKIIPDEIGVNQPQVNH